MRNVVLAAALLGSLACAGAPGDATPPSESTATVRAGWTAPDFLLRDASGNRWQLHAAAKHGAVVLVFYRGHW